MGINGAPNDIHGFGLFDPEVALARAVAAGNQPKKRADSAGGGDDDGDDDGDADSDGT